MRASYFYPDPKRITRSKTHLHALLKRLTIRSHLDELLRLAVHSDNPGGADQLHQERFVYARFAQDVYISD
jgi:hypothetical protein